MKIFSMNDCDWMAAETLEEAKAAYLVQVNNDPDQAFDEPGEIADNKYDTLKFYDQDGSTRTFREELHAMIERGDVFPVLFATTER